MATADVSLKLDEPSRVRFAHSPFKAFVFTLISLGFTWICWSFIRDEPMVRNIFVGFSLLFVLAGVLGIFWRLELDIDLASRRVRIRRGMWPATKTSRRALDNADGVWLTLDYRSTGSKSKRKVPWWFVSLKFPDEKRGTRLFASRSEVDGYRKWEYYAERFRLDPVDATAGEPQRKSWQSLNDNLATQARATQSRPHRTPNPPVDSTIQFLWNRGRKEILLPALGFNKGLVFLLAFGGAFALMGGSFLLASLGVLDMQVQGSKAALMVVPPVFVLVGLAIMWLGVKGSYTATIIGVKNSVLFTENLAFGRRSGRKSIPLADIESVSVGGDVRTRRRSGGNIKLGGVAVGVGKYRERADEVVVRSDERVLRFGGALTESERAWLADACHYGVLRGHLP